jgi:N-acylglucosamine 2-epimerase
VQRRKIQEHLNTYCHELFENVIPFWERHGIDHGYGGYFTCLERDGAIWSTDKYMWLQGRAVWMFARLHNEVSQEKGWLELAQHGLDFIRRHGRTDEGRVFFALTRDGRPIHIQRKIYSEVFFLMALTEMARATNRQEYLDEARDLFWKIYDYWQHPARLGRPILAGSFQGSKLANPMVFLSMIEELQRLDDDARYVDLTHEMKQIALRHIHASRRLVLEHVGPNGEFIDTPTGRLVNPGHAIEMAWFLIHLALRASDSDLIRHALQAIDWSIERGWDQTFGGFFYFLDCAGRPPTQLEWSMKLWWPITEALYALLLAQHVSGHARYLEWHERVHEYAFSHFRDAEYGEWFGYLDRHGEPSHTLKGGEWKGFFHLPRALLYSIQLLKKMRLEE